MTVRDEFKEGYKFQLENVQVEWCYFVTPDTKFGKSQWKCNVRLEENLAKSMQDSGFNIKHTRWDFSTGTPVEKESWKPGGEEYYFIVAATKTTINGKEMSPPRVVGHDGQTPVDGSKIGNGSTLNINVYAKYCEVNGKTFLPLRLNSVQLVDLVEYDGGTGFKPINKSGDTPSQIPF